MTARMASQIVCAPEPFRDFAVWEEIERTERAAARVRSRDGLDFDCVEWRAVERAARRLVRASGCGSSWNSPVRFQAEASEDSDDSSPTSDAGMRIARRAKDYEGHTDAGRWVQDRGEKLKRLRRWNSQASGFVAVQASLPDVDAYAGASFADLSGPLWPLLLTFSLESIGEWRRVEPYLSGVLQSTNAAIAGRDAMARILYPGHNRRFRGRIFDRTPIDQRAQQLGMRAAAYREETRRAELILRRWI